jgi:hypothetical protein
MHFFDWLPTAKLNDVDLDYPDPSDVTKGISPILGMLGQYWEYGNRFALKFSKTATGTLKWGRFRLVRLDPNMTAAIGTAVRGRPVFVADESNYVVTCDAATTKRFAGVLLNSISAKGNVTMIQEYGRIGGLFAGTATKTLATITINDIATFAISGGVATFDVLADATQPSMAQLVSIHNLMCRMAVANPTASAVNELFCGAITQVGSGAQ